MRRLNTFFGLEHKSSIQYTFRTSETTEKLQSQVGYAASRISSIPEWHDHLVRAGPPPGGFHHLTQSLENWKCWAIVLASFNLGFLSFLLKLAL
jgi:hypothetical protein